ncbi:hypothetical protein HYH03_000923 [Edaphochlamys debaryana]|uniref:Uncharacterized protein n=1 Tax=Edaphochlamys debaryana TaxID=47281 RepID=A0A835YDX8_9CHLO|nr:hypothetical protein HYH03_000923 [Edaphochlamys debaryana]|eukprot:KAG2501105.1 hypothetical protein HYH03_000923 [Edaphochlamys debaryana]
MSTVSSFQAQMHDGPLDGNNKCSTPGSCCAGGGNSCGTSGSVCDFTVPPASAQPASSSAPASSSQPSSPQSPSAPASSPASYPPPPLLLAPQPPAVSNVSADPPMAPPPRPSPVSCKSDTIWAAPPSTGEAQAGTTVPTFEITTGSPSSVTSPLFTWNPIQNIVKNAAAKWGGYFTVTTPSSGTTYSTATPPGPATGPFGCAGCAKNDPSRGYDVGGVVLQVRPISSTASVATCALVIRNNPSATVIVKEAHFYASYNQIPNFNPGQFPSASITGLPGYEGTTVTMTQTVGGTKNSTNAPIFMACHFTVSVC